MVKKDNRRSKIRSGFRTALLTLAAVIGFSFCNRSTEDLMVITDQGSFAVGGSVITNPGTFDAIERTPEGQSFRGDHAYVFYQIPENARKLPLVFWHGIGQFSKT